MCPLRLWPMTLKVRTQINRRPDLALGYNQDGLLSFTRIAAERYDRELLQAKLIGSTAYYNLRQSLASLLNLAQIL